MLSQTINQDRKKHFSGFANRVLLTLLLIGLAVLLWKVRHAALLLLLGMLVAVMLNGLGERLGRWTRLPRRWAVLVVAVLLVVVLGGLGYLLEARIVAQADQLHRQIADAVEKLRAYPLTEPLANGNIEWQSLGSNVETLSQVTGFASSMFNAVLEIFILAFVGMYLAMDPRKYRDGLIRMLPTARRARFGEFLDNTAQTLWHWLIGRLIAMAAVGLLTFAAMWLLGVPLAATLGVLTGLLEFVPFFGPMVALIPAILLGITISPLTALWVAIAYFVIFQIEGNLISPLVQQKQVNLPPVVALMAVITFGLLFGPVGTIVATPLAVILMVAVRMFYIEDVIGESVNTSL